MNASLAGIMAEFATPEELLRAAEKAYAGGYRQMDAYSPFPIAGLAKVLHHRHSNIPLLVLVAGITGGLGGYFMEWYTMAIDYPLNIGGRPLNSWPAFIPITFELTVLCAALTAVIAMLILNKLPQPYHPVFNVPAFVRASVDRFFLCIEAGDLRFNRQSTTEFLRQFHPIAVTEVPA